MMSLESRHKTIDSLQSYIATQREVEDNLHRQIEAMQDRLADISEDIFQRLIEVHELLASLSLEL